MKIKSLALLSIVSIFLFGCSQEDSGAVEIPVDSVDNTTVYDGKIVALGDSLTEGLGVERENAYPAQLQNWLQDQGYNYEVINSGISGETTTGLVERLDWVLSQNPDVIILTSGANDAIRGLDLEITQNNLSDAISKILAEDIGLIFSGMEIYENLGTEYVAEFKNVYPKLADTYEVSFIPFFLAGVAGEPSLNNADLIHPNKDGYTVIVEKNVGPVVRDVLEELN